MKKLKRLIIVLFTILSGVYIGTFFYEKYRVELTKEVSSYGYTIYLLQYGVYSTYENMVNAGSNISDYFYYQDKDGYHIIIGITENKNKCDKIRESYDITENIYIKEVNINNKEFIESLRQYDVLLDDTNNKNVIINAEKQIMSKYEELVLNNE